MMITGATLSGGYLVYPVQGICLLDHTSLLQAILMPSRGPRGCLVEGTTDIKERITIDKKERKNQLVAYGLARAYARIIGL